MRYSPRINSEPSKNWTEGDPVNNGGYGGGYGGSRSPTFAALQAAGYARPAAPAYSGVDRLVPPELSPANQPRLQVPVGPPPDAQGGTTLPYNNSPAGAPQSAPPAAGTPTDAGGESDFEKQLRERYQNRPNAPQFTYGATAQSAKDFVPGANPFTDLNTSLVSSALDQLKSPSGYTSDAATATFNRLGGSIDDQYDVNNKLIDEEMARRGIPVSTIAGGRLFDSNVARKSAKEDLAGRILTDQAQTIGADRSRAIASAAGLSSDDFNRQLAAFNANEASGSQAFNQEEQTLHDYLGFGQQGFSNSLATQQANNQQQQQLMQMLLQLFGGTGGGTA